MKNINKKYFVFGVLSGVFFNLLVLFLLFRKNFTTTDVSLNNIQLINLKEQKIELSRMLGKPLILNYWATWCKPCLQEFQDFEKAKAKFGEQVQFMMISEESIKTISDFKANNSYSFDFVHAPNGLEGINVLPATFFYDKDGKLLAKHIGSLTESELVKIINQNFIR
jgi:thiol-disulfide isomerase/thioredoxin